MSAESRSRSPIIIVTLYTALYPLTLPWLPVCTIAAIPSRHDPGTVSIYVTWLSDPDSPPDAAMSDAQGSPPDDPTGWRSRVSVALERAATFSEMVTWLEEGCNGISMDMTVEVIEPGELADAHLLTRVEDTAFAEHVLLRAEVEVMELVLELAQG